MVNQEFERAQRLGTATLHEASGRRGALPARLKPAFAGSGFAGRALPVSCPAGDNLWIQRAIYEANPGDVLVVAIDDGNEDDNEFGYWGEILSEAAKARSLGALVIDGGVRDTVELASVGFPVFATSICIRGTLKNPDKVGSVGEPVTIGEVRVARGDMVVGDADGVVVVAADELHAILDASDARLVKEADIIRQLREGRTSLELYNLP